MSKRVRLLQQQVRRIEARLRILEKRHKSISWYRLAVFVTAVLLAFLFGFLYSGLIGLVILLFGLAVFAVLAVAHSKVERTYLRNKLWRDIKRGHIARASLDWAGIKPVAAVFPADHPFGADLDLAGDRSLHQLLDVTGSAAGSTKLLEWISGPVPDRNRIMNRQKTVRELVHLSRFRDKLLLTFALGEKGRLEGEKLEQWLETEHANPPLLRKLAIQASLLVVANYVLVALYLSGVLQSRLWELSLLAYLAFFLFRAGTTRPLLDSAVELDDELSALGRLLRFLESYPADRHPELARLVHVFQDAETRPTRLVHRAKLVTTLAGLRMNPLAGLVLNLLLPWDFVVGYMVARLRDQLTHVVPVWLGQCAEIESTVALATFAYLNPHYVFPTIVAKQPETEIALTGSCLGHPLIPSDVRVCNDFSMSGCRAVVLTGSNMSGKSTFLKTLGTNAVLAFAGAPVCASSFELSTFRVFTCMRVNDSVQDHVSSFYAEVRRLKRLLQAVEAEDGRPVFYLIDEIFRGTNNRERAIGAISFLERVIGLRGAGLITTHDLEVAHAGEGLPQVRNQHFREEISGGRMMFDYRIRAGICPTTNALKIMELEGLPVRKG